MAKLIFRSNYFKNESARHRANYVKYLGTREGAAFDPEQLPKAFYEDADMHGKKENYVNYVAGRPGAVWVPGQRHGLFTEKGARVDLEEGMKEVSEHQGTVWINVVSIKREDAERLNYDKVESWQRLIRGHVADLSDAFRISMGDLKWYAAFHDEGHHPHVHLLVYSKGKDGYLGKAGIQKLRSVLAQDIFKNELENLYDEKTKQRNAVKKLAGDNLMRALDSMAGGSAENEVILQKMAALSKRLRGIRGRKVYGYLHRDVKAMVDDIFRELEKVSEVRECYEKWIGWQGKIVGYYRDDAPALPPLSQNPEFKSVKNLIIREAVAMQEAENAGHSPLTKKNTLNEKDYDEKAVNEKGTGGNAVGKHGTDKSVAGVMLSLLKQLEQLFQEKVRKTQGGGRMISEWKFRKKELERKAALGEKSDGGSEDITQTI